MLAGLLVVRGSRMQQLLSCEHLHSSCEAPDGACLIIKYRIKVSCAPVSHRRRLSPPAQILLSRSLLSLVALDSTPLNICACESPVRPSSPRLSHKKTVGPCSLPQNLIVPLPALGKKGGDVTADSSCSCTAESRDCRARSSLHVGDRYPIASRRSC
jgi:hypothetical protein